MPLARARTGFRSQAYPVAVPWVSRSQSLSLGIERVRRRHHACLRGHDRLRCRKRSVSGARRPSVGLLIGDQDKGGLGRRGVQVPGGGMCLLGRCLVLSSLPEEVAFGTGEETAFRASKLQLTEMVPSGPLSGTRAPRTWGSRGHSELASCLGRWCRSALGTHKLALPSGLLILRVLSIVSSALGSSLRLGGADGGPGGLGRSPQDHLNLTAVERTLSPTWFPWNFPSLPLTASLPKCPCPSCHAFSPFPGGPSPLLCACSPSTPGAAPAYRK